MTVKKLIGKVHLYLGLISGLVVLVLGVTGCILVFEEEIRWLNGTSRIYKTVSLSNSPNVAPSLALKKGMNAVASKAASLYTIFKKKSNAAIITWHYTPHPADPSLRGQWYAITQDPYTGDILTIEDWNNDFWGVIFHLHTNLLLPYTIGSAITSYSTLIFIVMMITGLVLWYPKSRKGFKQRFSIKWGASPKRLNYDLHNVFGFYMTWMAIFIALTGIIFGLAWFRNGVYKLTTGEELNFEDFAQSSVTDGWKSFPNHQQDMIIDSLITEVLNRNEDVHAYSVGYPLDSASTINISIFTEKGKTYERHNEFSYDRYSGKLLSSEYWKDHNVGERILHLNYPIHLGHIGGLPTKILAFFASLIAASLPVTGFYIWWGRRKRTTGQRSTMNNMDTIIKQDDNQAKIIKPARFN